MSHLPNMSNGRIRRTLWAGAGILSLGLGLAGIPLPLLPTTPFLILAAFCFSRSSQRLHDWLVNHPKLGPPIRDWNEYGAIPLKAKILATVMMGGAILAAWAFGAPRNAILAQLVIAPLVCLFIWTRPHGPRAKPQDDAD